MSLMFMYLLCPFTPFHGEQVVSAEVVPPYRLWYGGSGWFAISSLHIRTFEMEPSRCGQVPCNTYWLPECLNVHHSLCGSIFESSIVRFGRLDSMKLRSKANFQSEYLTSCTSPDC